MSNRRQYLTTGKDYVGKHQRSGHHDRDSGHSDKYYHGWGAGKDKTQSTFEKSGADPYTSQKRKAYDGDHSDTLAKRPRFNENYHQRNYDTHSNSPLQRNTSKMQKKPDTVIPPKKSDVPSAYAHLPPSPPRYAKPVDNNARLLQPPAGIQINVNSTNNWKVVGTNSQAANSCYSGNIKRFDDDEGYKTNTANFPQISNKASGDCSETQSGDNNNAGNLHRFKDIKDYYTNTEKLSKCSNSATPNYSSIKGHTTNTGNFAQLSNNTTKFQSGTGFGDIKGYETITGNLQKPPNCTPGNSSNLQSGINRFVGIKLIENTQKNRPNDNTFNTNTDNIPEVVKPSNSKYGKQPDATANIKGYKTTTGILRKLPNCTPGESTNLQSGINLSSNRFGDIKLIENTQKNRPYDNTFNTNTDNIPEVVKPSNSKYGKQPDATANIKGYKTTTGILRKPPNCTPGESTNLQSGINLSSNRFGDIKLTENTQKNRPNDNTFNTNTDNIPEVVKPSNSKYEKQPDQPGPMIVAEQQLCTNDNNRKSGSIKQYPKLENTDNYTGNKSTYVENFGPLNSKPPTENINMNLSKSNGKAEHFQLFPIALNPKPLSNADNVISKGSAYNSQEITNCGNNRTRPSRFNKPLPENNIIRSPGVDNNGQLRNAPPFDNIKNTVKTNHPNRFNGHRSGTQLADNIWPLPNAPQSDNIGNPSKYNRLNVPPPGIQGPFDTTGHPSKIVNNNRFNVPPPGTQFGNNSGSFNNAPRYNNVGNPGQNMNTNRFSIPPPGTQFENKNGSFTNNMQQLDNIGNASNNNNPSIIGDFNGQMKNTIQIGRFGKNINNDNNPNRFNSTPSGKMEGNSNTGTNNNSGVGNNRFNRNTGNIQPFANTPGTGTRFNSNPGNNGTFNQTFSNNGIHGPPNNNRFNRNTGNLQRYPNQNGNTSTPQFDTGNTNKAISRFDNNTANFEPYINNTREPTNIDNNRSQFGNNKNSNTSSNNAADSNTINVQQFENNGQSQENISKTGVSNISGNVAKFSDSRVRQYENGPGHNAPQGNYAGDYGTNLQFGMRRRTGIKSDFGFINKMDQHFGNNNNNSDFNRPQLPMNDVGFQINPPLFHEMGGTQRFYDDINPAPPVEDNNYKSFETQNNCPEQTPRFGFNNNGRGSTRRFGNTSSPGQTRQFGSNNGRQFVNYNGPPSRNQQFGNKFGSGANRQTARGRGNFNQRRNCNTSNRSQTGYNKISRFGTSKGEAKGRFGNKSSISNGNSSGVKRPLLKKPFGDMKNRFGRPQNKFGKLLKRASNKKTAKGPKNPNKEKKTSGKLKKPKKTKDGDQKPEDDHIDINKEVFGDFQPIAVGQKKPAKGHLKPEPETYWKQWWSLYGYVEKCLTHIDPTDESVKSLLHFNYTPTDSEYRQRKRTLLVMGVAKILRHIRLNESDYALRDIFNVLKYKHQLEDPQFQQHLTPKEMERVERVLKHARKKTRRALFYQSLICRWHFSTLIIKRAENGESLKCGHARKLISDKVFNYLVLESIQELKKLTLEDWPEFDEFYKTL